MTAAGAQATIIIPAHNEAQVIARALERVRSQRYALHIIVAANGCTDRTADIARRSPGVEVIELDTPSKRAALNAADAAAVAYPRVYLDADVALEPGCLDALLDATSTNRACLAVAPAVFDTTAASPPVHAFYEVFRRLPYVQAGYSSGVVALSEAGRRRFDAFPDLDGDDLYAQRLFGADETVVVGRGSVVTTPRDLRRLVRIRARAARGNRALAAHAPADARFSTSTGSTLTALARLVAEQPRLLPHAVVYIGVTIAARARAVRNHAWERDDSSR